MINLTNLKTYKLSIQYENKVVYSSMLVNVGAVDDYNLVYQFKIKQVSFSINNLVNVIKTIKFTHIQGFNPY